MNNLRELRESKGFTLRELGKEVNMSASVLGNYERGNRQPKIEIWKKLADYFNVSVPYIMGTADSTSAISGDRLQELLEKERVLTDLYEDKISFADMKDLAGNPLFDENDGQFNTQLANYAITNCGVKKLKGSNNLKLFYFIKLTDPTNGDIRFTTLQAIFYIDTLQVKEHDGHPALTMAVHYSIPDENTAINELVMLETRRGKIEGLTHKTENEIGNFAPQLFYSVLAFKKMNDRENDTTELIDDVLQYITDYSKGVIANYSKLELLQNNKIKFNVNYLNEEMKTVIA